MGCKIRVILIAALVLSLSLQASAITKEEYREAVSRGIFGGASAVKEASKVATGATGNLSEFQSENLSSPLFVSSLQGVYAGSPMAIHDVFYMKNKSFYSGEPVETLARISGGGGEGEVQIRYWAEKEGRRFGENAINRTIKGGNYSDVLLQIDDLNEGSYTFYTEIVRSNSTNLLYHPFEVNAKPDIFQYVIIIVVVAIVAALFIILLLPRIIGRLKKGSLPVTKKSRGCRTKPAGESAIKRPVQVHEINSQTETPAPGSPLDGEKKSVEFFLRCLDEHYRNGLHKSAYREIKGSKVVREIYLGDMSTSRYLEMKIEKENELKKLEKRAG